jgi:hypothetical protein
MLSVLLVFRREAVMGSETLHLAVAEKDGHLQEPHRNVGGWRLAVVIRQGLVGWS